MKLARSLALCCLTTMMVGLCAARADTSTLSDELEHALARLSEGRAPRSWTRERGNRARRAATIRRAYERALGEAEVPEAWDALHDRLFPRALRARCEDAPESAAQMAAIRIAVLRGLPHPSTVLAEHPRCERLYVGRRRVNIIRVSRRGSKQPVVSRAMPTTCERPDAEPCFAVEIRQTGGRSCVDRYLAFRLHSRSTARFVGSSCDDRPDDRE